MMSAQIYTVRPRNPGNSVPDERCLPFRHDNLAQSLAEVLREESSLPLPGKGATLRRWQVLAKVAGRDLSLAKLYEGHTDAIAILDELGAPPLPADAMCGTWAAEGGEKLRFKSIGEAACLLDGPKFWCSGAPLLTHALVTAWEGGKQRLALVSLAAHGVDITGEGWEAIGMAATHSGEVRFERVTALAVGGPGGYLNRPGFWHGGAGIAACWYGAAAVLASAVRKKAQIRPDAHLLAQVGRLDARLRASKALMVELAGRIDAGAADAERISGQARTAVELVAREVLDIAAHGLGAYAFCKEPHLARLLADLPVYLSQSHAERDWQRLGELACAADDPLWEL